LDHFPEDRGFKNFEKLKPPPGYLAGAQPATNCSFARHLVEKMAIRHLLITKHQPVA